MRPYSRKVQYYETDMMGIAHHANYIHWMEEARIDFMEQLGYPYTRMEAEGVLSPVRSLSVQYKKPCTFGDTVEIAVSVESFNGVVLTIGYAMRVGESVVCEAKSEHVFVNRDGRLVRMKRDMPEFCQVLEAELTSRPE
ncbi:MAG: acyl-CoA thioesterase [bacterium]